MRAEQIGIDLSIREHHSLTEELHDQDDDTLHCWNPLSTAQHTPVTPGHPNSETAAAVIGCIEAAALACLHGDAAALATGPIEKAVLRSAGFNFPGHTEFLDHLSADFRQQTEDESLNDFVMMLASDQLRVALLTTHMALQRVPDAINMDDTLKTIRIVDHDMRHRFNIEHPRLALCALNPHAGEQGHFGREEIDILTPATLAARQLGIDITDPMPADTLFSAPVRVQFDAIICCYHDQALIPLKTLSFGEAVNVTLGLPMIRTSVDHGTALDRVGQSSVSCSSLIAAIKMAQQMCQSRL